MEFVPDEIVQIVLTLALSFLIGLEREEHNKSANKPYAFGGVRTFPLIGLMGYMIARLSEGEPWAVGAGFLGLSSMMWLSYRKKLELTPSAGMTTEISGLLTFLLGVFVHAGYYWEAVTLAVAALMLLALKQGLQKLARRVPNDEIFTFTRFLLISVVILPVVPHVELTRFELNPYKIWLMIVALSGMSYAAYVIAKILGQRQSTILSAALGGLYSSTLTTMLLARRGKEAHARLASGSMLISSGVMYLRATVLLAFFSGALASKVAPGFLTLALLAIVGGWLWTRTDPNPSPRNESPSDQRNPLQVRVALVFALIFISITVLTRLAQEHVGDGGLYVLSFLSGLIDVDPLLLSLGAKAQAGGEALNVAANAAMIATASNNLVKACYAFFFGQGRVGRQGFGLLLSLATGGFLAAAL